MVLRFSLISAPRPLNPLPRGIPVPFDTVCLISSLLELFLTTLFVPDVPVSSLYHDDNRSNTVVPLSGHLQFYRCVRHTLLPRVFRLTVDDIVLARTTFHNAVVI